jgi:hypothetical protein
MTRNEYLAWISNKIAQAEATPSKPVRLRAGYYVISTWRGLVEIEQVESGWLARSYDHGQGWANCWVNDPVETLTVAVEQVTTKF